MQGGDRALLPLTTVQSRDRERFHPSSLIFWVFTAAPMVSGSWLTIVSEVGWLRSFFWQGSVRFLQTTQALSPEPEEQLTALAKDPNPLSRQEVPLLQLFTTALQPDAGWLQSLWAQLCAPARAAQVLAAKVGRGGRERYQKLFPSTFLWSYFSASSVVGCLGGEGGCRKWDVTIRREGLGFSDTISPTRSSRVIQTPSHQHSKWLIVGAVTFQVAFKRFTKSKKK